MSENRKTEVIIDDALITAFARAYVDEGGNALKACLAMYPGNTNIALGLSSRLMKHPDIKVAIDAAKADAINTLPTKAEYAIKLWERMVGADTDDSYQKLAKLYADVRGFIDKPVDTNIQNVTVVTPRCIEMPTHGSDDDWERKAAEQQTALMISARDRSK